MKREVAEAWVKDLRTNPPQAKGYLYSDQGYCCLGRLCLVLGATFDDDGCYHPMLDGEMLDEAEILPEEIMALAGMTTCDGQFAEKGGTLAEMNDSGRSFAEIADLIEKHWEVL